MNPKDQADAIIQSFGPQQTISEVASELGRLIEQAIEDAKPKWQPGLPEPVDEQLCVVATLHKSAAPGESYHRFNTVLTRESGSFTGATHHLLIPDPPEKP